MFNEEYALEEGDDGRWTVVDVKRGKPVALENKPITWTDEKGAKDAIALLNMVALLRRQKVSVAGQEGQHQKGGLQEFMRPISWKR